MNEGQVKAVFLRWLFADPASANLEFVSAEVSPREGGSSEVTDLLRAEGFVQLPNGLWERPGSSFQVLSGPPGPNPLCPDFLVRFKDGSIWLAEAKGFQGSSTVLTSDQIHASIGQVARAAGAYDRAVRFMVVFPGAAEGDVRGLDDSGIRFRNTIPLEVATATHPAGLRFS